MSKELEIKIPSNINKINTNDQSELLWWCAHLDVTPEKLLLTVEKVGDSIEAVRKSLQQCHYK